MDMLQIEMARRIRIRSWKDVAVIIALIPIVILLQWAVKKLFPDLSERTADIIVKVVGAVICVILLFAVGA